MFKDFLKKYSFVLCASLSSTACLAMELESESTTLSSTTRQVDEYTDFDVLRRRLEEDKAEAPQLLSEILAESREASRHYDKKFMSLYAQPTEELSENDNWLIKLYKDTLSRVANGYSKLTVEYAHTDVMKSLSDLSIFYYIMGAKAKCPDAYKKIDVIINGKNRANCRIHQLSEFKFA